VSGQLHLIPGERAPGTHWIGGWVGHRGGLDTNKKRRILSSHWESNSWTLIFQPKPVTVPTKLPQLFKSW